jgi:hypothetical protein
MFLRQVQEGGRVAFKDVVSIDILKGRVLWLIAGLFNPVSRHGTVNAFRGLSRENQDRWSP